MGAATTTTTSGRRRRSTQLTTPITTTATTTTTAGCSENGESCLHTKCCNDVDRQCYEWHDSHIAHECLQATTVANVHADTFFRNRYGPMINLAVSSGCKHYKKHNGMWVSRSGCQVDG